MNREKVLAAAALGVALLTVLALLAVPGAVSSPQGADENREPPGDLHLEEVTIAAGEVTGANATLEVDSYLRHRGNPVENVSVVHRATDVDTGLVEATSERDVGSLEHGTETRVDGNVTVPRRSGYRIETIVYADGSRVQSATHTVEGVGSLRPARAQSDVAFQRTIDGDDELPAIAYAVDSTDGDRVTLAVSPYLTNTGDRPESDLDLEVVARQSDSNVVADETRVAVGTVEPGETTAETVELTVPDDYDYTLDAVLWRDGTAVTSTQAAAAIGPGNLTVDESSADRGLEVGAFEGGAGEADDAGADDGAGGDDGESQYDDGGDGASGFGTAAAVVALLAAVALYARRDSR